MMKIAIVDDERPARSELRYLLTTILENAEYYEAADASSADTLLQEHHFQAIFLDINLGDVNGTILASTLKNRQKKTAIVFVTAYSEYAIQAYEIGAVDYILKPFDFGRIKKTIRRLEEQGYFYRWEASVEAHESENLDKLAVNAGSRIKLLDIADIIYIESNQRNCLIHTKTEIYTEHFTLNDLTKKLRKKDFYRIHKSFLVNLNCVEELIPNYNNGYAMRMKDCPQAILPISRNQIRQIKYLFQL